MIRPVTCICMLLAAGSGLYLYQTKHRTRLVDREIEQTMKQVEAARARIGLLEAEWALLNQPERLAELSDRFLPLKPVVPGQFVTMADLDQRLPPPLPPAPPPATAGTEEPDAAEAAAPGETPHPDPAATADAKPLGAPAERTALAGMSKPASKPHEAAAGSRHIAGHEADQAGRRPETAKRSSPAAETPATAAAEDRRTAVVAARNGMRWHVPPAGTQTIAAAASHVRAGRAPEPPAASEQIPPMARPAVANMPAPVVGSVLGAAHVAVAPPVPVTAAAAWTAR
jgi:hypothetical protein